MRYANPTARRGVLLLVILALLAMFGMVAVTFVVVASQARLAAEAHQRVDETTDPPRKLLNAAVMQVIRGSTNDASAIGPHSLLEDVFGFDNAVGPFSPSIVTETTTGGLIDIGTTMSLLDARRCVGGVLTVTDTSTKPNIMIGRSARIVDAVDVSSSIRLRILPFQGVSIADAVANLVDSSTVLVNRTPFTGAGFTAQALRPGHPDNRLSGVYANEDYDAADFQNMILAAQIPVGTTGRVDTIPSLHRPALVNYWDNHSSPPTGLEYTDYILRPTRTDMAGNDLHPKFTGGNVNGATALGFDAVDGPWDVDNDGDGIADSIWVDLGFPARAAPGGQLYKPLFAILCVDMDGKLNLNAHGGLAQINADPTGATGSYYTTPTPTTTGQQFATASASLVRGQGYGPAEINLGALFSMPPAVTLGANAGYQALLTGGSGWSGRYGSNAVPGEAGLDPAGERRWFDYDYATGYWPTTTAPTFGGFSGYGTPPDMQGTMAVGLDLAGRPIWDQNYSGQVGADNPYESSATQRTARGPVGGDDEAYSPAELERILRCYDRDSLTLPPRLYELLQLGGVDVRYLRHDMTTDSVDMPVPGGIRDAASGTWYATLTELLQTKYSIGPDLAVELFGPDLAAGRKLNLNQPLPSTGTPATDLPPRQRLARHLFCLAMLLRDPAYRFPFSTADPNVSGNEEKLTIKRIAQWAVNVVDFIDADSVMTPFEYVDDPFATGVTWRTGLPVSGTTDMGRLVWGMERPVLLLTETLAFHDRRVADTSLDDNNQKKRTDQEVGSNPPKPADDTLDQVRRPQGSLFVELYCAAEPAAKDLAPQGSPHAGPNLFASDGRLHVSKRAANTSVPVWRLAITENAKKNPGLNSLVQRLNSAPSTFTLETDQGANAVDGSDPAIPIERVVSFGRTSLLTSAYAFFYLDTPEEVYMAPGEYLLIGPRAETVVGMTAGGTESQQKITLTPTVSITDLNGTSTMETTIKAPKAVIAKHSSGAGISVSEPVLTNTYPDPEGPNEAYDPVRDKPLDSESGRPLADDWDGLKGTATRTTQAFKYVLLQRLADASRPYNPTSNPYRTVDWMPIDLTVFNGQDTMPAWPPAWAVDSGGNPIDVGDWDPDDPDPNGDVEFDTRERGRDGGTEQNLWEQGQFSTLQTTPRGSSTAHFSCDLNHSLGYLNTTFGTPGGGAGIHIGDPVGLDGKPRPFPWITWNNRPPASPLELMMVPATTAARHGWEFTMAAAGGPVAPYGPAAGVEQYVNKADDVGYAHLMNFFDSGSPGPPPKPASGLHRIFDFLEVPSRFAGAQHYVSGRTAPDHLQPTYREPGKINLNTIYSERVFRGLMNGFRAGDTAFWDRFVLSREAGYAANPDAYPTEFARPFRSASSAHLWPGSALAPPREIESTLLRADPTNANLPLFASVSGDDINNTGRNPYFRHQGLMRLANLTTTRSNVYAVWITVGYFEATPTSNTAIPGGYLLGRELGVETGEIRRHRAFYMIDRSIPVGFVRGEDMNAENTIMLQRYVE